MPGAGSLLLMEEGGVEGGGQPEDKEEEGCSDGRGWVQRHGKMRFCLQERRGQIDFP